MKDPCGFGMEYLFAIPMADVPSVMTVFKAVLCGRSLVLL